MICQVRRADVIQYSSVAKYLQRSCPKCNGYLGIVVPERRTKMPVQAINERRLDVVIGLRGCWFEEKRQRS
jgi:hypothetical protein